MFDHEYKELKKFEKQAEEIIDNNIHLYNLPKNEIAVHFFS